ncbi:MAG: YARHG domain-containing protein [Treponema sp.]|jgi:hypothetical protein|nr:YARHG domain-containing protein [Treponema sp.]
MKKIFAMMILCLNITVLSSQDLYTDADNRADFADLLRTYNTAMIDMANVLTNNSLQRILLGEIALLNNTLILRESVSYIFALAQLDNSHLRLLRNMIYAKHGYIFNSSDLNAYFRRFAWYTPRYSNVDNRLTNIDRQNIEIIQLFESRNENMPDIVWDNATGIWDVSVAAASGYSDIFIIDTANRLRFGFSSMMNLKIISSMSGTYYIKGNVLVFHVTDIAIATNTGGRMVNSIIGFDWEQDSRNLITFRDPIIYKFPISEIHSRFYGYNNDLERTTITIGGIDFHWFPGY